MGNSNGKSGKDDEGLGETNKMLAKDERWVSYMPWFSIIIFICMAVTVICWGVYFQRALDGAKYSAQAASVDIASTLNMIQDVILAGGIMFGGTMLLYVLLIVGRAVMKRSFDQKGKVTKASMTWLVCQGFLTFTFAVVLLFLLAVLLCASFWYMASVAIEAVTKTVLSISALGVSIHSSKTGYCTAECLNLEYFDYLINTKNMTASDLCICEPATLVVIRSEITGSVDGSLAVVVTTCIMIAGSMIMLGFTTAGFAAARREKELATRVEKYSPNAKMSTPPAYPPAPETAQGSKPTTAYGAGPSTAFGQSSAVAYEVPPDITYGAAPDTSSGAAPANPFGAAAPASAFSSAPPPAPAFSSAPPQDKRESVSYVHQPPTETYGAQGKGAWG
jgi:hypothetical protein